MRTAVIYEGPAATVVDTDAKVVVGVPADDVVATAIGLARAGVDRIELCGGFGPVPHAEVVAALAARPAPVPEVGTVLYGFESLEGAAAYKARFAAGEHLVWALLHADTDAPDGGRRVDDADGTPIVAVRPDDVGPTAAAMAAAGVGLIELYAGLGTDAVAAAVEASGGLPVGLAVPPARPA